MHDAGQHLVLLVFAIGFSAIGWFMAHNPTRVYRAFTMDASQFGQKVLIGFCRIVGWCFTVVFAAGALMQVTLMFQALLR
jgi:hypothetical protein